MPEVRNSTKKSERMERLLRSLVGVIDVRLVQRGDGVLREVHLLRDDSVQDMQLARNATSGLRAMFGVELGVHQVIIHTDAGALPAAELRVDSQTETQTQTHTVAPAEPETQRRATSASETPLPRAIARRVPLPPISDSGHLIDRTTVQALADGHPMGDGLQLERVDVERQGVTVRCRVVLLKAGQRYTAAAETAAGPTAEAELAARVTLDALRAGALSSATLEGVSFITVGDTNFVAVSVRHAGDPVPRASAAPLVDSIGWSAAVAVLSAAGRAVTSVTPEPVPVARHELR